MFGIVRVYTSFVLIRRRRESQPSHKLVPKHSENQVQKLDTFAFEGLGMECPMLVTAARSPLLPLWDSPPATSPPNAEADVEIGANPRCLGPVPAR